MMRDDPFKAQMITHKRRYYNETEKAIHAAGNLCQHEGPSTRNMCM